LIDTPDSIALGNRQNGDPLKKESQDYDPNKVYNLNSKTGISGGVFEYSKTLQENEKFTFEFAIFLDKKANAKLS
jgi:hypothetical protein